MNATFTKVKDAPKAGEYKQNATDKAKSNADFRLVGCGSINTIIWANGRTEHVKPGQLKKLQNKHTWKTDF